MLQKFKSNHPRLHKNLFTVTTFSKYLALSMLIIFPIIAFILGYNFQKKSYVESDSLKITPSPIKTHDQSWPIEKVKKEINNKTYYFLKGSPRNLNGRYIDSLRFIVDTSNDTGDNNSNSDNLSYWMTSYISENTKDFWLSEGEPSFFYTVESIAPQLTSNPKSVIKITFNKDTGQMIEEKIIYTNEAGTYSGSSIVDYFPEQKTLLMETRGGDGCGGWGIFWKLDESGRRTDIQKYGIGCVLDENTPDYKGYLDKKLYLISQKPDPNALPPIPFSDDKIYEIDVVTGARQIINNLPQELTEE